MVYAKRVYLSRKLISIAIAILIALSIIVLRLAQLQILLTSHFFAKSRNNFLRMETTPSPRGNIVDCTGQLLATNRPVINIYWNGSGGNLTEDHMSILNSLANLAADRMNYDESLQQRIKHAQRYRKKALLVSDINFDQLSKIKEQLPHQTNISFETHFKRFYPHYTCASHALGYLGRLDTDMIGKMGLEKLFHEALRGQEGQMVKTINSVGRNLREEQIIDPQRGADIHTLISLPIQQILEQVFPTEFTGAALVLDPHTGAIKAMLSRPNFDPNIFLSPISFESWQELQENQPFLNRVCGASYPPGSIFKLVTISAALETNIVQPDEEHVCGGFHYFGKRKYWCHKHAGHGVLNTRQALAQSCNILFFNIARQVNIDLLAHYAHQFGLGQPTNMLLPEKTGLVPTTQWKEQVKGERWWPGETLSAAIGQSYLLVTPMQVARMIGSIFTGQLVTPRILSTQEIESQPVQIRPSTLRFLQHSMKKVVTTGTGRNLNKIKDITIYAKTSTAQTSGLQNRFRGKQYREHGWFVGYFQYKNHDPLIIVLLVEHASTSRVPTNIAKNFLLSYRQLKGLQK